LAERPLRLQAAVLTHEGRVREVNEDSVLARPQDGLWAVADGMGGHAHGRRAAGLVTAALEAAPPSTDFPAATQAVAEALRAANAAIFAEAQALGGQMGSTAAALLVCGEQFAVLWVGDSRVYQLRDGRLVQLTTDHSQVQEMVTAGRLTPEEAERHPMAHVLSRAVGVQPQLAVEAVTGAARAGDIFLICSDGLIRTLRDAELETLLGDGPPQAVAERLVSLCLERGAPDNVSVVVVACDEPPLAGRG